MKKNQIDIIVQRRFKTSFEKDMILYGQEYFFN